MVVKASALTGPNNAKISPATCGNPGGIRIYHEVFLQIGTSTANGSITTVPPLSDQNGIGGFVPDALVPQVDEFDNQCRWTQSTLDTSGPNQVLWVDILVPRDALAGHYTGQIDLAWSGTTACETGSISIDLKVWGFLIPSMGHLASHFGSSTQSGLPKQHGAAFASGTPALSALVARYAALGLDHHIAMTNYDDGRTSDLTNYANVFRPLNAGISTLTRLGGAAPLRVSFLGDKDTSTSYDAWHTAFGTEPWFANVFTYTVDEPGTANGRWCDIGPRGRNAHQNQSMHVIPALVTKDIDSLRANAAQPPIQPGCTGPNPYIVDPAPGGVGDINIAAPVIDALDRTDGINLRGNYGTDTTGFIAEKSGPSAQAINAAWTYESCDTHGCASYSPPRISGTTTSVPNPLWPSIGAIDHSLVRARAMPWMAYKNTVSGILYYDTVQAFSTVPDGPTNGGGDPWHNQYLFGGNGDGTLFYPGTPAALGVPGNDFPIASLRLKMLREGLEDYEYMILLGGNRQGWVNGLIASVYRNAWETDRTDIDVATALYNARHQMACQYLTDHGLPDPDCGATTTGGGCTDPANPNLCGGSCTNFLTDPTHCGNCTTSCASGFCNNGRCAPACAGTMCCGGDLCRPAGASCPPAGTRCN